MSHEPVTKIAILGASRGLGEALLKRIQQSPANHCLISSRKGDRLEKLARKNIDAIVVADFTTASGQKLILSELDQFMPEKVFYVAGGGPFGAFSEKKIKDHLWALELGLVFPTKLLHHLMSSGEGQKYLKQVVLVGSAIAGQSPDPFASSYAAAKHGLRGLVTSIQAEKPPFDIRIYEPGYIDTDLLPPNAWPRQHGIVASREDEALRLWQWSQNSVL